MILISEWKCYQGVSVTRVAGRRDLERQDAREPRGGGGLAASARGPSPRVAPAAAALEPRPTRLRGPTFLTVERVELNIRTH